VNEIDVKQIRQNLFDRRHPRRLMIRTKALHRAAVFAKIVTDFFDLANSLSKNAFSVTC
jgi:hypothetical protein